MKPQHLTGSTNKPRAKSDFYRTPAWATQALLNVEYFPGTIWEPACGDGAISLILHQKYSGRHVFSSDIEDRGFGRVENFLESEMTADNIVTNPPYSLAKEFTLHALKQATTKVALLLKLNFLEGQERKSWLPKTPLQTVYVFSKRLSFNRADETESGSGLLAYAWFVWHKSHQGPPQIKWL